MEEFVPSVMLDSDEAEEWEASKGPMKIERWTSTGLR